MMDSLTILRSLLRERLPAFVEAVEEGRGGVAAAAAAGSSATGARRPPSARSLRDWEWDMLTSPDTYARLIGAFELNNIEVKVASPLADYWDLVLSLPDAEGAASPYGVAVAALEPALQQVAAAKDARRRLRRRLRQLEAEGAHSDGEEGGAGAHTHGGGAGDAMEEEDEDEEEEEEEDDEEEDDYDDNASTSSGSAGAGAARGARQEGYEVEEEGGSGDDDDEEEEEEAGALKPSTLFPCCNGTALYALVSQMNHSCEPNVAVTYPQGSHVAAVTARRAIAAGEELCINYVGIRQPRAARQKELAHYGFVCTCPRCEAEKAAEAAAGKA
jgi:hypothetical protein